MLFCFFNRQSIHGPRFSTKKAEFFLRRRPDLFADSLQAPRRVVCWQGVLLHIDSQGEIENYETDRLDAINKSPKDTAGAGDSMLITSSLAIAAGANHWEAACLGNIAASIQVGRVGNIPLTLEEFKKVLNN